jgi:hypothetical protein
MRLMRSSTVVACFAVVPIAAFLAATRGTVDADAVSDAMLAADLVWGAQLAVVVVTLGRRHGLALFGGFTGVLTVLFGWSQAWPDVIPAPIVEWGFAAILVGWLASIAVLIRRRGTLALAEPGGREQLLVPASAVAIIVSVFGCCCLPVGKYIRDEPYAYAMPEAMLDTPPSGHEVRPLAPATEVAWERCVAPYAHGTCTRIVAMRSADGLPRDALAERLVEHYRSLGWPLEPFANGYSGCRPVRGIIAWTEHCMSIYSRPDIEVVMGRPELPDTVNVYVR